MAAMDSLVLSSGYGEAAPLCILEAMAAGVPVVASNIGDCAAMIDKYRHTVTPGSPDALASAVFDILARSDRAEWAVTKGEMVSHIRGKYSLPRIANLYEDCYRGLASSTGGEQSQRSAKTFDGLIKFRGS